MKLKWLISRKKPNRSIKFSNGNQIQSFFEKCFRSKTFWNFTKTIVEDLPVMWKKIVVNYVEYMIE